MLRAREDARLAVEELLREPAAAIFARAHAGPRASEEEALFRTVLLGLLISTADACGGFDWDDEAFERAYATLEHSLFGEARSYAAVAPLVGLSLTKPVLLAPGLTVRGFVTGELAEHWPEARGLLPPGFGRELDRSCVLELRRGLGRRGAARRAGRDRGRRLGDSPHHGCSARCGPGSLRDARRSSFGIRPVLPIAATQPPGEPSRLDAFRRRSRSRCWARSARRTATPSSRRRSTGGSSRCSRTSRSAPEQLRVALAALLGDTWPLRCSVLLSEEGGSREELYGHLTALAAGDTAGTAALDAARRAVVAILRARDRIELVHDLDRELLGLRRRDAPRGRRRLTPTRHEGVPHPCVERG